MCNGRVGALSPWRTAAVLLFLVLLVLAYQTWRERPVEVALGSYGPLTTPAFELRFSQTIPYDPLSFVGRGAQAGFWQWQPDALVLTDEGRKFFEETEGMIVSRTGAGTRKLKRVRSSQSRNGVREIEFFYEWVEIAPPAATLLSPPPRQGEEYLGRATLAPEGGSWKVVSLETRDFEEPLARLQDAAGGVRR